MVVDHHVHNLLDGGHHNQIISYKENSMAFETGGGKTICIDWNGVLDMYTGYANGKIYPMRPGAVEFLRALNYLGYDVTVLSAAEPGLVYQWLDENGLLQYVSRVTDRKVPAIIYIDDRGLRFDGDFGATLEAVSNFRAHWEEEIDLNCTGELG